MPHLVVLHSAELEQELDIAALLRNLADCLATQRDANGVLIFPTGGIRVFSYPATHSAIADGSGDYRFMYAHLRIGTGRAKEIHQAVGDTLSALLNEAITPLLAQHPIGVTLQIDESTNQVFDFKASSLHPLFQQRSASDAHKDTPSGK
ncbi:hypothetical protein [Carnimonas bestiolae]|uniref:hypothetical protein n=1 Tax=Carnimonas bestiolae TaxID=3402172 RepID=UPI003EDB7F17